MRRGGTSAVRTDFLASSWRALDSLHPRKRFAFAPSATQSDRIVRARRSSVLPIVAFLIAVEGRAHAHAPPAASRIVFDDASGAVLVTNRGLIFGDLTSGRWTMMCSNALGIELTEQPDVAFLPDGRLLAATSSGLRATRDRGCAWSSVKPFEMQATSALAQHPMEPRHLYVSAATAGLSVVWETVDGGGQWTQLFSTADGERIERIAIAPSMPARLYASGRGVAASASYLWRSSDAGRSWERLSIPLRAEEKRAVVAAISPGDPGLVVVLAWHVSHGVDTEPVEPGPDRAIVTRDGGQSWSELTSGVMLQGAGFGVDGTTIWVAGADGLSRSNAAPSGVQRVGRAQLMSCVGAQRGKLYACGNHSGFDPVTDGIGVSTDDGASFSRWMAFTDVRETVACEPASNTARVCADLWTDWQLEELVGVAELPVESVFPNGIPMPPTEPAMAAGGRGPEAGGGGSAVPVSSMPQGDDASGCSSIARISRQKRYEVAGWFAIALLAIRGRSRRRAKQRDRV